MPESTGQQPVPVAEDPTASIPELLARAADDYTQAETRRQALSHEDRVHGQQHGGQH